MKTLVFENAVAWSGKSIDNTTADRKTQELMKVQFERIQEVTKTKLESIEIAAAVKKIILGENTNFRCQTNVDFLAGEIASKLKDPASNEPIEMIAKRLYGERKDEN